MRKTITIGDLGTIITGKTPPTTNKNYYGDYAVFIKPTDISELSKYTYETEEMYSKLAAFSAEKTYKREKNGLLLAARQTKCENLLMLTDHESGEIEEAGHKMKIQPVYEWSLEIGV